MKHLILVKFFSGKQVEEFYSAVRSGRIFLPVSDPLPEATKIDLKPILPYPTDAVIISGTVSSTGKEQQHKAGIFVDFKEKRESGLPVIEKPAEIKSSSDRAVEKPKPAIKKEERKIEKPPPKETPRQSEKERSATLKKKPQPQISKKVSPPASGKSRDGLSFENIKEIVSTQEVEVDFKKEEPVPERIIPEKVELTLEERKMAEPVGKFIMNLTKAMTRSGYYDPNHPSSKTAKMGLYNEFIGVAGGFREISFTHKKSNESADIFITGILDKQVNVKNLVGAGAAELFVPKLSAYCDRKQLLSFAIKKEIPLEHFDLFIDIMSDPKVERDDVEKKGEYLTNVLIENDISEISTVFLDEMLNFESDLPWRVQMAMHRLAKDLKVMPMFKGVAKEAIKKIKLQTIQDIIRPLNHPKYFNDFLVNSYIIAKHVEEMEPEEIQSIIVDAFPLNLLLPTSYYTFSELEHLNKLKTEQPENPEIDKRIIGIKGILKMIASRITIEKASGAISFLEKLYRNQILAFNELPLEAQYLVNTQNLAIDVKANFNRHMDAIFKVETVDDAMVYLKCFRRVAPVLADEGNWKFLLDISNLIHQASNINILSSDMLISQLTIVGHDPQDNSTDSGYQDTFTTAEKLLTYVFGDILKRLISAYENPDKSFHPVLHEIFENLGTLGVSILSRVLEKSEDKETRKLCFEFLVKKGDIARKWALGILGKDSIPWYVHRNALMILRDIPQTKEDFEIIRKFLYHSSSKIREEMISLVVMMHPFDRDFLIIKALDDSDARVRWRATRALMDIAPISASAFKDILKIITTPFSDDKDEASEQMKKLTTLISAVNGLQDIPDAMQLEADVLDMIQGMTSRGKGLLNMLKRVVGSGEEIAVLQVAIPLLGRIGGGPSERMLKKLTKTYSQLSDMISKELAKIEQRSK